LLAAIQGAMPSRWANGIEALCEIFRVGMRADLCFIALLDTQANVYTLHGSVHQCLPDLSRARNPLATRLILQPGDGPAVYHCAGSKSLRTASRCDDSNMEGNKVQQWLGALADMLGLASMMSVPVGEGNACIGRIYVGSKKQRYSSRDMSLFWHSAKHAFSLLKGVQRAERLAKKVASQERRRISGDVRDTALQPYVGLKLGLEAMRRRFRRTEFATDLDELIKIANDGIGELRQYVMGLKRREPRKQDISLLSSVRTQAQKFAEFYGIDTQVIAQADIAVNTSLQTDVMHIVREGLSNIFRHTRAKRATIKVRKARGRLILELINDKAHQAARKKFYPRSIGERATQLGGRVSVRHGVGHRTVVAVELPLGVVGDDDRAAAGY
jgi:signal transduction histidine kinase